MVGFGTLQWKGQSWASIGTVQGVERDGREVRLACGGPCMVVSVLAPNMVRLRIAPSGDLAPRRSWAVTRDDMDWPAVPFQLQESSEAIEIATEALRVRVLRDGARVDCFDTAGQPIVQDIDPGASWRLGSVTGWKRIQADEHFYGFGERTGLLDKRAEIKTNWTIDAFDFSTLTDNMYQAIPFFIALRPGSGYGLFLNTTYWSRFDIGVSRPGVLGMETRGPELDYYLIYGPEPARILQIYTELNGRMPLPPRWALGYQQCRWSYESETIVRDLARQFRERSIPCDVIYLDIDYMRGYRVFTWVPKRFANPAGLLRDLAQDGFRVVTIVDPGVKVDPEADYQVFDQGIEHDYFIRRADGQVFQGYVWPDRSVFPDFLRPEVRRWWGDLQEDFARVGVAGIWNDMNEPSIHARPFGSIPELMEMPPETPQGPEGERATHAEVHNLYGLMMSRASREGLDRQRPDERQFVLTRSGFAGIQRWSAVWMGDNQSLWDQLETSLPMLCNMGLSGVPFVGCDIGGFVGNATGEMFARWMQVGLLYPLMRAHSSLGTERHEPWSFGERVERICREYIELRYRLLPYIYTLFWEASTSGAPILRPLVYHFPNDSRTYEIYDQVLLGPSLLAAPVYRPGVDHRVVYLPEGGWYDWWTGRRFEGATHILADAPLERLPLYARSGAIIPMGPVMQHTGERQLDELRLLVFPGSGELTLYEDDGQTPGYRQGEFAITPYRVGADGERTVVEIGARQGRWTPPEREAIVELVGVGEQRFRDDGSARRLTF